MRQLLFGVALMLAASPASANFIVNGDFEKGNTGFTTAYVYSPGDIGPERSYDIVTDPALSRPRDINPVSYKDHTSGAGLMMAVNESFTPNLLVWGQTVAVRPNTPYVFSLWISSWFPALPSRLDVRVNGISVGTASAPSTVAVWQQFRTTWNTGSASSVVIELRNLTNADVGGDFALDDISLTTATPAPPALLLALTGTAAVGGLWTRRRWGKSASTAG